MKRLMTLAFALAVLGPAVAGAQQPPMTQGFDLRSGTVPNNVFLFALNSTVGHVDLVNFGRIDGISAGYVPFDFFLNDRLLLSGIVFAPGYDTHDFHTSALVGVTPSIYSGGSPYVLRLQPTGTGLPGGPTPGAGTVALDLHVDLIGYVTPEPTSMVLFGTGLIGVFGLTRRRLAA